MIGSAARGMKSCGAVSTEASDESKPFCLIATCLIGPLSHQDYYRPDGFLVLESVHAGLTKHFGELECSCLNFSSVVQAWIECSALLGLVQHLSVKESRFDEFQALGTVSP